MNRRNLLIGLGGLASAGGAVGSGAFTSVAASRDVTVAVEDDAQALLKMTPSKTVYGRKFATMTDGDMLALDFDANGRGDGLGTDSAYEFDDVFTVTNQGTQQVHVWGSFDTASFGDGTIWLYPDSESDTRLDDDSNVATLAVGETLHVGVHIDTEGIDPTAERTVEGTIHAAATQPDGTETTAPDDGRAAPSNLVAHYPFEGNAVDATGNGNDGSAENVEYTSGVVGQAASFDGTAAIEVPDAPELDLIGDSFAIALWMRTTSEDRGGLVRKNMTDSWQPVYSLEFDYGRPDRIRFLLSDTEGETPEIHSTTAVDDGEWHHVVGMYDDVAEEFSLYVDGAREASQSASFEQADTDGALQIGRMVRERTGTVTGTLEGSIDDLRIYDRILTADEIADLATDS